MSLSVLESENPKFKLFPNPLTDNLNIINLSNSENMKIKIVDIHGKVIYQNNNVPNSINTSNWSNGLYFVQINNITHKIIKVD